VLRLVGDGPGEGFSPHRANGHLPLMLAVIPNPSVKRCRRPLETERSPPVDFWQGLQDRGDHQLVLVEDAVTTTSWWRGLMEDSQIEEVYLARLQDGWVS